MGLERKTRRQRGPAEAGPEHDTLLSESGGARDTAEEATRDLAHEGDHIGAAGRFELIRLLGRGGMGVVFAARDLVLDREVAVKFITPRPGSSWEQLVAFLKREAQATARLSHDNIVSIFDLDTHQGAPFLVMEFLRGDPLSHLIDAGEPFAPLRATEVMIDVVRGLEHAHAAGIIHRDLKPSNVFITGQGRAKVLDFGLARTGEARSALLLSGGTTGSATEGYNGTPAYMSPEQWREDAQDARTDIWSAGVMFYEMLLAELPFTASQLRQFLLTPLPRVSLPSVRTARAELPEEVDRLLAKAVSTYPSERFQGAGELLAALLDLQELLRDPKQKRSSVAPRLEPERRLLTLLSCRLLGGGAAEQGDPEEDSERLHGFHQAVGEIVRGHDAFVAASLSGQLLACFGFPVAQEDDTKRALRAGLQIVRDLPDRERGLGLDVRVGIHTSVVVVQQGAGQSPPALQGEATGTADWLARQAAPNTVLVSERAAGLVPRQFAVEPVWLAAGDQGSARPANAFRVQRELPLASRFHAAGGLSPLVGRSAELAGLSRMLELASQGDGQFLMFSGEPGIGKSRLLHELEARAGPQAVSLTGQCWPQFKTSAFHPVIQILTRWLKLGAEEGVPEKLARIDRALTALDLPPAEYAPPLASLLSLPTGDRYPPLELSPVELKFRVVQTVLEMVRHLAAGQLVLLMFEDVHWVDASTLELLNLLVNVARGSRALVAVTFRLDFLPPWTEGEHVHRVALDRLPSGTATELVGRVSGAQALPGELVEQLVRRADGVPLFLEQLTRMAMETSVGGAVAIPDTIQDLLVARLDAVPGAGLQVAQLGAVIGREFSLALLRHVWPHDVRILEEGLAHLVDAGLLLREERGGQAAYAFKHALIQEVAYDSLLKKRRAKLHGRIAEALIEHFPQTRELEPELLAHHFGLAGNAAQAISYWDRAGQRAAQRWALSEAISDFGHALDALRSTPPGRERDKQELGLQLALGAPLMGLEGYSDPEVGKVYDRARALARALDENSDDAEATLPALMLAQLFSPLVGLWQFFLVGGRLPAARELADQLLTLSAVGGNSAQALLAHRAAGTTRLLQGDLQASLAHSQKGLALYDPERYRAMGAAGSGADDGPVPDAQWMLGSNPEVGVSQANRLHDTGIAHGLYAAWALWLLGRPDEALRRSEETLALAHKLALPVSLAWAGGYTAMIRSYRGEFRAAKELADAACALAEKHKLALWLAWGTIQRGWALIGLGQHAEGAADFRRGTEDWRKTGAQAGLTYFRIALAEAYLGAGQPEPAERLLHEAAALVAQNGEHFYEAELQRLLGELELATSKDPGKAEQRFVAGLEIARRQSARAFELRLAASRYRLLSGLGRAGEARPALQAAVGTFAEGLGTADVAAARSLLAG